MGIKSLSVPTPSLANPIPNKAAFEDMVGAITGGNFDRDHAGATTSFITLGSVAPSSPKTGEFWLDAGLSPSVLKKWSGTAWEGVLYESSASAPSTTTTGAIWYDTNLNLLRVYETQDGLTGWHPVDSGYELWKNSAGAQIKTARVVRYDTSDTTDPRAFRHNGSVKAGDICGVTLEETEDGETGILAMLGTGLMVDLYVAGADYGAVSRGDALVNYGDDGASKGEARTVGPLTPDPYSDVGRRLEGTPYGAFAQALESTTVDEVIRARLLPQVGGGAHVVMERALIFADTESKVGLGTSTGAWAQRDVTSLLLDADHTPILGVGLEVDLAGDAGVLGDEYNDCYVEFSLDQTTTASKLTSGARSGAAGAWSTPGYTKIATVDEASGSATGLGNVFSERVQTNSGQNSNSTTATMYLIEYWY